jgi:hypothetical protein
MCNGLQWKWLRTAINRNLGPDYLHLSIPSGRDYLTIQLLKLFHPADRIIDAVVDHPMVVRPVFLSHFTQAQNPATVSLPYQLAGFQPCAL